MINYVSSTIYEFISEAETYSKAIDILKPLYTKPVNVIYNCHVLITHRQNEGEMVDQFMQKLERLSKQCEFTEVSAETYRCDYIREAFINGLNSPIICQRLLENNNLTLEQAFAQARSLKLAQLNSASYISSNTDFPVTATVHSENLPDITVAGVKNNKPSATTKCYFCGNDCHA